MMFFSNALWLILVCGRSGSSACSSGTAVASPRGSSTPPNLRQEGCHLVCHSWEQRLHQAVELQEEATTSVFGGSDGRRQRRRGDAGRQW